MATASLGVRERMAAASKRIARVKLVDRGATGVITFGGIFIILSVLFIFVFIFGEAAAPLPRAPRPSGCRRLTLAAPGEDAAHAAPLAVGVDEYQRYLYDVTPDGRVVFFRLQDGSRQRELPIPGLAGAAVTTASRSLQGDLVAVGTSDGRVALVAGALQARLQGPGAPGPRDRAARPRRASRSTRRSGRSAR